MRLSRVARAIPACHCWKFLQWTSTRVVTELFVTRSFCHYLFQFASDIARPSGIPQLGYSIPPAESLTHARAYLRDADRASSDLL